MKTKILAVLALLAITACQVNESKEESKAPSPRLTELYPGCNSLIIYSGHSTSQRVWSIIPCCSLSTWDSVKTMYRGIDSAKPICGDSMYPKVEIPN